MKTPIQQLIEKYNKHLKQDDDLDSISGRDILKIVLVDLISYQVKEKQQIIDAYEIGAGCKDVEFYYNSHEYYNQTFKQD